MNKRPAITVDIIISSNGGIVLVKRRNPPVGWALPGGFVDYGETVEKAALREAKEETNLEIINLEQFYVYSDPNRDPRIHTISVVFVAEGKGKLKGNDDALIAKVFSLDNLPNLVFDHKKILEDFKNRKTSLK